MSLFILRPLSNDQNHFLYVCIISLFTCSLSIVSEGPDSPKADDVDRG